MELTLDNELIVTLIDTGASHTFVNVSCFSAQKRASLKLSAVKGLLTFADGKSTTILGLTYMTLSLGGKSYSVPVHLVEDLPFSALLGLDVMRLMDMEISVNKAQITISDQDGSITLPVTEMTGLNVVSAVELKTVEELNLESNAGPTPEQEMHLGGLLATWKERFKSSSGRLAGFKHKIYIEDNTVPIKQRNFPMSPAMTNLAQEHVNKMLEEGLIQESTSPWASPIVFVNKSSGGKRMCIDYRMLNKVTKKNSYPIPRMDDILNALKDSAFVSKIDLASGYYQIQMDEDSQELTAFTIGRGLYEFRVMSMGLSNAPSTFQSAMNTILKPIVGKGCFVYLDDVIIVGETFEEHWDNLNQVFELLFQAGAKINWEKSDFLKPYLVYLGYIVGQGELRASPTKIEPIVEFPPPKNVSQLRTFLGMAGHYRRFIKNYAKKVHPLNKLLRKGQRYHWGEKEETAFQILKTALTQAPVLACPDFNLPFEIHCDASNVGLGAVLVQRHNHVERPVAFASRGLTPAEGNYGTTELECLAIIFAVEKFRCFVEGTQFTVITDHGALVWLQNFKNPTGRLARWICRLSQYNFTVVHRKGALNKVPDALSRMYYNLDVAANHISFPDAIQPDFGATTDAWYLGLREKISANAAAYPNFKIKDNFVVKLQTDPITNEPVERILVPTDFREALLNFHHSHILGGHLGAAKTLSKLASQYYWPKMRSTVQKFVASCQTCQKYKPQNIPPAGLMADYSRQIRPGTLYSCDIVGPLPLTLKQNRFAIVFVDVVTKWVIAVPVRAATSQAVSKALVEDVILQFGCPEVIQVDNGSQFISNQFHQLCNNLNIRLYFVPKYAPYTNMVERYNRQVKQGIAMYAQETQRVWDIHLKYILFSLRTSASQVTGFTPARLTFGRELRSPFRLGNDTDAPLNEPDYEILIPGLDLSLQALLSRAQQMMDQARREQARRYNLRRRAPDFEVGQAVWKKTRHLSSGPDRTTKALMEKYDGPYVITNFVSPSQVELETSGRKKLTGRWHVSDLKPVVSSAERHDCNF